MKKYFLLVILVIPFISCNKDDEGIDVDTADFEAIRTSFPYETLEPQNNPDYWELVQVFDLNDFEVLMTVGNKCQNATDTTSCIIQLDGAFPANNVGFDIGCLPSFCFKFLRIQSGDSIEVVASKDELLEFLGPIDSKADAILWATANNYYFRLNEVRVGGINETNDGYELLLLSLVSDCLPVQVNRFHLKITTDGTIRILDEAVESKEDDQCI